MSEVKPKILYETQVLTNRQEVVSILARQNTRKLYKNFYVFYYRTQDTCSDYHVKMLKIVFRRRVSPPGLHIRTLSLINWGSSADVVGELIRNCQLTLRTLYSQPAGSKISLSHRNTVVIGGIARVCTAFESPPFNIHYNIWPRVPLKVK